MPDSQITNGVYFSCSFEGHGVELFDFGVLEVELHDVGVASWENSLGNLECSLKVIRVGVVKIVEE